MHMIWLKAVCKIKYKQLEAVSCDICKHTLKGV